MRHIIPISGKDSLATAIWQTAHQPDLPYEFVFNDTQAELPETYAWLDKVEQVLGITITRIGKNLERVIEEQGMLPSAMTRFCTRLAKIRPMEAFIGDERATVYFGLRSDEPERVGATETKRILPSYPLRQAGIGLAAVYRVVGARGLMPPAFFWQRLYAEVTRQTGVQIIDGWEQWVKDRVFAWRSRPNCYFCFFMRLYEAVGLLEHHPRLFDRAQEIEETTGNDKQATPFFWIRDNPFKKIRENADLIFQKRADAVVKLINRQRQGDLFEAALDEMDIAGTSCGLLCGK